MSQVQYERNVSNRTRFAVLSRDNHTCQYCGRRAPDVSLAVDHIIPLAQGGTNEPDNLITACDDCNQGKADFIIAPDGELIPDAGGRFRKGMARIRGCDPSGHRTVTFKRHTDLDVDDFRQIMAELVADALKITATAHAYRKLAYERYGVQIPLPFGFTEEEMAA